MFVLLDIRLHIEMRVSVTSDKNLSSEKSLNGHSIIRYNEDYFGGPSTSFKKIMNRIPTYPTQVQEQALDR